MKFYTNFCQIGPNLAVRYVENGIRKQDKFKIAPEMFIEVPEDDCEWKTLDGASVKQFSFDSTYDAKEFTQKFKQTENFNIHGNTNYKYPEIHKLFGSEYDQSLIRCFNIDIEVDSLKMPNAEFATDPITAITIIINKTKIHVFGFSDIDKKKIESELNREFTYHQFRDEASMLRGFVTFWSTDHPDAITGWNINTFDIPYLINRITNVLSEQIAKKLSPWNRYRQEWISSKFGKENLTYAIDGIEILDYIELYKKHTFVTRETYRLNHIAKVELGKQKLEYEGSLHNLFINDPTKYFAYNITDVILVDELDEKLGILNIVYSIAYIAKENYSDTFSPVKTWDNIICNYLYDRKICVPITKIKEREEYPGAFVKDPKSSRVGWGASVDISSAYPNTIRTWNIGPETRIKREHLSEELQEIKTWISSKTIDQIRFTQFPKKYTEILKRNKVCVSLTGEFYSVSKQSVLSTLVQTLYEERTHNKNEAKKLKKEIALNYDEQKKHTIDILMTKQQVQKILLNSLYGAIANPAFRFFEIENAKSITVTVQYLVQHMGDEINKYLNTILKTDDDYVQYIDTDSNYFNLQRLVDKYCEKLTTSESITDFIDKFCEIKISPLVKDTFNNATDALGCVTNTIGAGRENIYKTGLWSAKKRYAIAVTDSEGVKHFPPAIKVTGLEIVKSSTPEICRGALEECVKICLTGSETELRKYVKDFKAKYKNYSLAEIGSPRGVSDMQTYKPIDGKLNWAKKTPSHVKAANVFNYLIDKCEITNIPKITDGAKIKFVCLKTPNVLNSDVFGWEDKLPKEFDIEKYVDYDEQYEKTFLKPLIAILETISWNYEDVSTLDDFFG